MPQGSLGSRVELSPPVAPPNLTRDQAARRAAELTVSHYGISVDLTGPDGGPGEKTSEPAR